MESIAAQASTPNIATRIVTNITVRPNAEWMLDYQRISQCNFYI